jgi:hypothetical protein
MIWHSLSHTPTLTQLCNNQPLIHARTCTHTHSLWHKLSLSLSLALSLFLSLSPSLSLALSVSLSLSRARALSLTHTALRCWCGCWDGSKKPSRSISRCVHAREWVRDHESVEEAESLYLLIRTYIRSSSSKRTHSSIYTNMHIQSIYNMPRRSQVSLSPGAYTHVHTHVHTHTRIHTHTHAYTHMHMHTHTLTHTYIHRIHTHTHTH